jgi:hypothetical protein
MGARGQPGYYGARGQADYYELIDQVTAAVTATVPASETVLVVSKGDQNLLRLGSRNAWHFPRLGDGRYAGYYPADSADAITQLEDLRERGANFIVFPATSLWWLDHYPEFNRHLETRYKRLMRDDDVCAIYALNEAAGQRPGQSAVAVEEGAATTDAAAPATQPAFRLDVRADQLASFLDSILPGQTKVGVVSSGDPGALSLSGREMWHFPRTPSGAYAGHAPADTAAALDELEGLRGQGLEYLVIPRETPWVSHYPGFVEQVERHHRCVARQRYLCSVYDLTDSRGGAGTRRRPSRWRRWLRALTRAGRSERG